MKKITITLLLSLAAFVFTNAQIDSVLVSPSHSPIGSMQVIQDNTSGDIGIGISAAHESDLMLGALSVSNDNFSTAPTVLSFVQNGTSGSSNTGNSQYSIGVIRGSVSSGGPLIDFSVDWNGLCGIGFAAAYFNPHFSISGYSGTILGVIDLNNADTTPLLTVSTNTNNPTSFNLAALTVDYRGYTSLGGYFPQDIVKNPAHLFLTDPNPSGTDALLEVVTNTNAPSLFIPSSGYVGIGEAVALANAHLTLTDPDASGTDPLLNVVTNSSHSGINALFIEASGNVGIGTGSPLATLDVQGGVVRIGDVSMPSPLSSPGYSLYVQYGVLAESYKCALHTTGDWSDYVFNKDYKLKPLSDVESYIKDNHHLPDVPSADDVVCDGIDMASMDATLLKKIEELTLYVLELKKDNEAMKVEISNLKK